MHQGLQKRLPRTLGGLLLLFALEFLSPRSAQAQSVTPIPVSGQVVTEEDAVITSGVKIVVETRDGTPMAALKADSQGHFEIPNLFRKTYLLTVSAEGFYPDQHYLDLKDGGLGPRTLRIVLTRAPRRRTSSPSPALTDMSAPKEARKAFERAVHALHANRLDLARKEFEKAIAEHPCYARALTGLAAVQTAAQDSDAAAANLRHAIQCDAGFPDAFASLGRLLNSQKKFVESEEILKQGLRVSPQAWQLYDQLATAHYNEGQYDKAEEEWLRVLSINSAPPSELHAKLAAVYLQAGARDKAYSEMQAYLHADPNGRFASKFRAMSQDLGPSGANVVIPPKPGQPVPTNP
jgi:tetratricopeptide (TPR) repeat protein